MYVETGRFYSEKRSKMLSGRVVVWFSCGAASAVAARLAVRKYGRDNLVVAYCASTLSSEHPDNARFLADVERWIGHPVTMLYSDRYADTWDVWEKTRWLVGPAGARCTAELKKAVRQRFEDSVGDRQIFGFTREEAKRADNFRAANPEVYLEPILIDEGLGKAECLGIIERAGIEIPAMYRLGYRNNNCIGCVKGQSGYWNKIRRDFPEVFDRMARMERRLDVAINKNYDEHGKRLRVFLDELDPDAGRHDEPDIECGLLCHMIAQDDCD